MNTEALFLFLILLLGLVLCSFLGSYCSGKEAFTSGSVTNPYQSSSNYSSDMSYNYSSTNYDNYNHYTGSTAPLQNGAVFYGPNGGTITVVTNSNGTQSLQITTSNNATATTYTTTPPTSTSTTPTTTSTSTSTTSSSTPPTSSSTTPTSTSTTTDASGTTTESYTNYYTSTGASATVFYGPYGSTATVVVDSNGQQAISLNTSSGTVVYTANQTYYNPNVTNTLNPYVTTPYYNPPGTAGYANPPGYNPPGVNYYNPPGTAGYANPPGSTATNAWLSALPPGIPFSQIPPGEEDLYILKSQIVPPVCPACNSSVSSSQTETCPPCPACARCEYPPVTCKAVPNYNAINDEYLPSPVLNDFSTFGM